MKRKIRYAAVSAISAMLLTSCGEAAESSSLPEEASQAAVTVTTTTAAQTVTTEASVTVTEAVSSSADESSQPAYTPLTEELFEGIGQDVEVRIDDDRILETAVINERAYSLTIDLAKWEHHTTPEDMVQLSKLFWQSYPRMHERFGEITGAPFDVQLAIENRGYEIADSMGDFIHLHDMWLAEHPGDYDCITHELGHIVQAGSYWEPEDLEYSNYIELFADLCRFEYPLDGGSFNDSVWTLWPADVQDSRETSVRFLVWLDYTYSDYVNGIDLIGRFCDLGISGTYSSDQWDEAWQEIFLDTDLEGKTADEAWELFTASDFSMLSSEAEPGTTSELLSRYDVRTKLLTFPDA